MYRYLILFCLISVITPTHAFNLSQKLAECESHLKADRLTSGRGGTALACYEAVLKQEPTNSQAWRGLDKIKARYSILINRALNQGKQHKVEAYQKRIALVVELKNRIEAIQARLRQEAELEKTKSEARLNTASSTKPKVFPQVDSKSEAKLNTASSTKPKVFPQVDSKSEARLNTASSTKPKVFPQIDSKSEAILNPASSTKIKIFPQLEHSSLVRSITFSPNGKLALLGSEDNTLKLWDLSSGRLIRTFKGHSDLVSSVAFSPNGKLALSGSADGTLNLWDVSSWQLLKTFEGHFSSINYVAFSPNGKGALSGSTDGTLNLWNVSSGQMLKTLKGHYYDVISPDGKQALLGSTYYYDDTMRLWEVSSGRLIRTFKGHSDHVSSVAFSPDGKLALSGSEDHTIKLWNLSSGQLLKTFEGHSSSVTSVAFSPDGKRALSSSANMMRLWDVETSKEIAQMLTFEDGEWITITPEGYYIASLNGAKHLKVRVGNQVDSIDQYEAIFHRPDLVKRALELGDS